MDSPPIIRCVVYALMVNIVLSTVAAVYNAAVGHISLPGIVINIVISIFVAFLAYKIYHGDNSARYLYAIFYVLACFLFFGCIGQALPDFRYFMKIVQLPINVYILYGLFRPASSAWFRKTAP